MGITITGLEADALAAKKAILGIVNQYESMIKEEVQIDPRVHSMIIGRRGRSIRKIMDDFKVDIRLPREGDADPSLVVITGDEEAVLTALTISSRWRRSTSRTLRTRNGCSSTRSP